MRFVERAKGDLSDVSLVRCDHDSIEGEEGGNVENEKGTVLQPTRHLQSPTTVKHTLPLQFTGQLTGLLTMDSSINSVRPLSFSSSENSCSKRRIRDKREREAGT